MASLFCFDLDGTLVHSAENYTMALNQTLSEAGRPEISYEEVVRYIGTGLRALVADLFPDIQNPEHLQRMIARFLELYEQDMFSRSHLYPQVPELLENLISRGHQIGLITNKNERPARLILSHYGLTDLPWVGIFGADTLGERKPSPIPLREMMRRAGREQSQTWMIGDGTPDVESAHAAGVRSIALESGYTEPDILRSYKPLHMIKDTSNLASFLASLS